MSPTDWMLLAIVVISAVLGLMRGFVGVLVSLVAWVLAGWAALRFGGEVSVALAGDLPPSTIDVLMGHALSFFAVLFVVGLVGWIVRWALKSAGLSGVDRALGLVFGIVRGGVVACAVVLLLGLTSLPREPEWRASRVVPVLVPGAQMLRAWLPEWVAAEVDFGEQAPAAEVAPPVVADA